MMDDVVDDVVVVVVGAVVSNPCILELCLHESPQLV